MKIKHFRNDNHLTLSFIRPGICVVGFGIMYHKSPEEVTRWIGPTPVVEWVDNHRILQAMKTWWFCHRLWMTISASSGQHLTKRQARWWNLR